MTSNLILRQLMYTGPNVNPAMLRFSSNLTVIFGASNTGKSFVVKTIDFMLGGSTILPDIRERTGYELVLLGVSETDGGDFTLTRAIAGGNFELVDGLVLELPDRASLRKLSTRNDSKRTESISQFLLNRMGLAGKRVARDTNGKTQSLSFRDIAPFCIVDETTILSEKSPAESGQHSEVTLERSVFKLLLTGVDDSAITQVVDRKTFKTATSAKIEVLDEMITSVNEELEADYSDVEGLADQIGRVDKSLQEVQAELDIAQSSTQGLLSTKRTLAIEISDREQRLVDVEVTLARFDQLDAIYRSDIERLEALEEAGFLLSLDSDNTCPLCGAPPDVQQHDHGLNEIERVREAAVAEIEKIRKQRIELDHTVKQLQSEKATLDSEIPRVRQRLAEVENELAHLAPQENKVRQRLADLIGARDRAKHGLSLIDQKQSLIAKRDELAALRPAGKSDKPRLGVDGTVAHDFAQVVSRVLKEWRFPGNCHVSFDEATYDLRIDGKLRRNNGKGVRAVTHAAFKVALLIFCRERNLPHPGFIVLDTPLLPYRDPLNSKAGELSADEKAIAETPLKQHFFEHLAALRDLGQFIVVENIDPPEGIDRIANTEVFYGNKSRDRFGLFPVNPTE